jgi:hypothetical protein
MAPGAASHNNVGKSIGENLGKGGPARVRGALLLNGLACSTMTWSRYLRGATIDCSRTANKAAKSQLA